MKPCISLLAAFLVSMICLGDAAPLSTSNEESLAEVLRKSNLLLDRLLAGIPEEGKDKQDFEVELNERQNMEEATDEQMLDMMKRVWRWNKTDSKWVWVPARPERSPEDDEQDEKETELRDLIERAKGGQKIVRPERETEDLSDDGHLPYEQKDDDDGEQVDEVSLKEAIRWLQELREARKQETQ